MRAQTSLRYFVLLFMLVSLSFSWISCNTSPANESGEQPTATDTGSIAVLEMKRPGSMISKDSADAWVKAYRKAGNGPFSTQIVIHHPDAVKFYMDSIFNKFTPGVKLPQHHVWRIAYSPMFYKQPGGPKLSFCMVPCIVDTSNANVYEFFTEMNGNTRYYQDYYLKLYNSIVTGSVNGVLKTTNSDTTGFVFNEGQLWP